MKVSDYIRQFRTIADDKQSANYLWSDDEIALWAHQGYWELAKLTKCIRDKYTAAVCTIAVTSTAGALYSLHSKIIDIYSVKHSARTTPLTKLAETDLDSTTINWWTLTKNIPDNYILDTDLTKILLYPIPTADATLTLSVARLPMINLYPYTAGEVDNTPSEIREDWQPYLLEYILYKAYLKDDIETFNEKKSTTHYLEFERKVDQVKRDIIRYLKVDRSFGLHGGTL